LTEQVWLVDVQDEMDGLSRILARIVTSDGFDLGRELMAAGLAKVETKGHGDWCK
jgi:endonuclease YncB( thermonuclease family)